MEPLRRLPVRAGIANRDRQMDPWRGIGRGRLYNQEHIQFLPGARQGGRNLANVQVVNVQNVIKQLMDRPNRPKQDPQVSRINVEGDILSYQDTDGRRRVGVYIAGIPLVPVLNYFEVEVLDTGLSGSIAVGLVPKQYRMDDQPGWNADSVAYHLDDGKLFKANGRGRAFGTPCEVGDKVGCGIKFQQLLQDEEAFRHVVPVFFTKNGKEIGTVLTPMPQHGFFPAVGMHSEGEEVRIVMEKTWECNDDILMSIDNFEDEWARLHDVRLNGQLLEYTGRGKSIADVGLAQAKFPLDTTHHYFEIEIVDPGENCYIAIGLARKDYPSRRHPGWNKGSVAYHADDGKVFIGSGIGDAFGPKCNKGDIMGCGILFPRDYSLESDVDGVKESDLSEGEDVDDYIEVEEFRDSDDDDDDDSEDDRWWEKPQPPDGGTKIQVFFTKNGKCVGRRDTRIPPGGFYPTVGMLSSDEKVRVDLRPLTG